MAKPLVAIVGRPNVGKSTFFNRAVQKRVSIIEDIPGVTRDRIYADCEWQRYRFSMVDTGGIDMDSEDVLLKQMRAQVEIAVDTADVIVFMVDGRQGVTSADADVADFLRRSKKPAVLAVNKVDSPRLNDQTYDFYNLGMGEPIGISAQQGMGTGDLLDAICAHLPRPDEEETPDERIHIAIVGKPNAGKSSLVNALLGENRVIVSDIPGTTRDAIDTDLMIDGQPYVLIDTAGIRKKSRIEDASLERYSVMRSLGAVRRADVVFIVLDATAGVTEQDTKIAGYAHEEGKACCLVVNKWDLIEKDTHTMNKFKQQLATDFSFMDYAPCLFISAKTGQRVQKVLQTAQEIYSQSTRRITTGMLNDVLTEAIRMNEPPSDKGRRVRVYYGTQVSVQPPTFVLFVNNPELMHYSYTRYLENHLRKTFGFEGTPIRFILRARDGKKENG